MADIYGFGEQQIATPLTADKAVINWGGPVVGAINVAITYSQPIQRRRTIGNKRAVIFAGMPSGQITISRLMTTDINELFSQDGWQACKPGQIDITLAGGCGEGGEGSVKFTATGCIVSSYSVQAEAEGLTVLDNVVIEFLQLSK